LQETSIRRNGEAAVEQLAQRARPLSRLGPVEEAFRRTYVEIVTGVEDVHDQGAFDRIVLQAQIEKAERYGVGIRHYSPNGRYEREHDRRRYDRSRQHARDRFHLARW